jgi:hypothetical protein
MKSPAEEKMKSNNCFDHRSINQQIRSCNPLASEKYASIGRPIAWPSGAYCISHKERTLIPQRRSFGFMRDSGESQPFSLF